MAPTIKGLLSIFIAVLRCPLDVATKSDFPDEDNLIGSSNGNLMNSVPFLILTLTVSPFLLQIWVCRIVRLQNFSARSVDLECQATQSMLDA